MSKKRINTVTGQEEPKSSGKDLFIKHALKTSDELIKKGDYHDLDVFEAPGLKEVKSDSIEKLYPNLSENYFDPYESYINPKTLKGGQFDLQELGKMRAENQSNWEQAGNALGRIAVNIIPQIAGGFASMVDIQGYWDAEHAANNSIVNWAQDVQEWSEEALPIYEEAPGQSMQLGDPAWWFSRGSSLVTSIGAFLAQGAGVAKGLSLVGKGLGAVIKGKDVVRAIMGAEKSGKVLNATKRISDGSKGLLTATMLNQSEAVLEATQVYNDTYERLMETEGVDEIEARKKASLAASTTMNLNRMNILLNLSSASAFIKPSTFTRQLLKAPSLKRNLIGLGFEGAQEASEELINHVASKAGIARGEGREYTLQDALSDMGTMEGFEAAFLGALGGIGQTGGQNLLKRSKFGPGTITDEEGNRISAFTQEQNRYQKQQEVIEEFKKQGVNVTDAMKSLKDQMLFIEKLKNAKTEAEQEELRNQLFEEQALKAFQSGTTEVLENLYKAEANKSIEEVGEEHIERANNAIKNLKRLENVYNNFEGYANMSEIFFNRANKMRVERAVSEVDKELLSTSNSLSNAVNTIAKKYSVSREGEIINKKEGKEVGREKTTRIVPLSYQLDELENNPETTKDNKKIYNQFLNEVKQLPQFDLYNSLREQKDNIEDTSIELDKNFKKITSKKYQAEAVKREARKKAIAEANTKLNELTSISDIEKLKEEINDAQFSKKADAKIKQIKIDKEQAREAKKKEKERDRINSKIESAKLEDLLKIKEEIEKAEIPKAFKDSLQLKLQEREAELKGETPPSTPPSVESLGFSSTSPEENTEQENKEDKAKATAIPPAIPKDEASETEDTEKRLEAAIEAVAKEEGNVVDRDADGNLVYNYLRSVEGHNRLAYLSRDYIQTEESGVVNREDASDDILNKQVLDPEDFAEGSKITLEVDYEYVGEKYDPKSKTKKTFLWRERAANMDPTSQEYIDEVPIKVTSEKGTVVYLHDVAWISPENVDNTEEQLAIDRAILREVRKRVLNQGKIETKVSFKGNGRLILSRNKEGVIASEALPDSNIRLAIGKDSGEGVELKYDTSNPLDGEIIGNLGLREGTLYAIVPMSSGNYIPVPLKRNKISKEVVDSIMTVLEIYLSEDYENPLVDKIANSSLGADITTLQGVRQYLNQFLYLYPLEGNISLAELVSAKNEITGLNSAVRMIAFTGNSIELGRPGVNLGGKNVVLTLSKNFKKSSLAKLPRIRGHFEEMLSNADLSLIETNGSEAVLIQGEDIITKNYKEYLKEAHNSRVLSENVGTEENPKYVYTLQPTITYDTSFVNKKDLEKEVKKKKTTTQPTDIEAKKADIEKRRQEFLPNTPEDLLEQVFDGMQSRIKNPASETSLEKLKRTYDSRESFIQRIGEELSPAISEETKNKLLPNFRDKYPELISDTSNGLAQTTFYKDLAESLLSITDLSKINAKYNAELTALEETADVKLSPTDKIIWGHPGLGKTTFKEQNPDKVLDFDTDFKPKVAELLGLPKEKQNSQGLNEWRNDSNKEEYERVMREVWQEAIAEAKATNKMLVVSDMMFLRENSKDFDKIITTSKETFIERTTNRGDDVTNLESWKSNIDKTISSIEQDKVISTNKYFSELVALEETVKTEEPPSSTETDPEFESNVERVVKMLVDGEITEENLGGIIENLALGNTVPGLGVSPSEGVKIFKEAIKRKNERAQQNKASFKGNIFNVDIDGNTKDDSDEDEFNIDDAIPVLSEEEKEALDSTADQFVIKGVDGQTQHSLVSNIGSLIIEKSIKQKDKTGDGKVEAGPIFEKVLEDLKSLQTFYEEKGFPNKANKVSLLVEQFDKVKAFTNQYLNLLSSGSVTEAVLTDNEEASGLEKVIYTDDWAFTINSKNTASADLRRFFSSILHLNPDYTVKKSSIGLPVFLDMDVVYNTLHEKLANKPADFNILIQTLELYTEEFPWFLEVINKLEKAPSYIQNEFVSDMTKHHMSMDFIMWNKDSNGNYSLKVWNSNSSAISHRLRHIWNSNLRARNQQANIVAVNDNDEYIINKEEAQNVLNQIRELKKDVDSVTNNDVINLFKNFGITISDKTVEDIRKGKFKNNGKIKWKSFFSAKNSPIGIFEKRLVTFLATDGEILVEELDSQIMNDTSIKNLAKLEAHNIENVYSNSYNAGGKTVYSFTNNNYLSNRMRDLTAVDSEGNLINKELIEHLKQISFTSDSLWLKELTSEDSELADVTKETLDFSYLSLEALKKKFTPSRDNRKLNNLSPQEHEVTKINFFLNSSSIKLKGQNRRKVKFFYPTMSDKTTMIAVSALAHTLDKSDGTLSARNLDILYDSVILPEINRMMAKNKAKTIDGYEPNYFYFLPSLNSLEVTIGEETKTIRDFVIDGEGYNPALKEKIQEHLSEVFNNLVEEKLKDWESLNIGKFDPKNKERFSFLDKSYMSNVAKGKNESKVRYAAADFVFNSLIANAELHVLFVGDPALYFKRSKIENATIADHIEETSINIGKRLAGDIAPGIELANTEGNRYRQVFFQDTEMESNNVKDSVQKEYFKKIIDSYDKDYSGIEGSDAQEYTTWKEHLYVLQKLGRITQKQYDTISKKLISQSNVGVRPSNKLSYDELGLVLQPLKPVFVGNIASIKENVDRRVYVKSSSFPLIPELTNGMEIDKIRKSLEAYEEKSGTTVKASFKTANKVGAIKNAISVFDTDGTVKDFTIDDSNTLLLNRKDFRIQQDVPYKREKDKINIGTQARKLLFVNILDVEVSKGRKGSMLMDEYNNAYENLFKEAQEVLAKDLGIGQEEMVEEPVTSSYQAPQELVDTLKQSLNQELTDNPSLLEKLSVSLEDIQNMSFEKLGELVKRICS